MEDNVKTMVNNMDDVEKLEKKSTNLKESAVLFQKDAKKTESVMFWRKITLYIIITLVVGMLCGVSIFHFVGGSEDSDSTVVKEEHIYDYRFTNGTLSHNDTIPTAETE
mmetsp:Transcript_2975/g.2570  ORF Transcript_2975/g.2570 Transcript_2975/m.2570 type:complete len:109 (-) Transcript_2975:168-494(-)|eukprot:CAMPEP_0114581622 /NCGR_PEP_ID=MMETSP0125-20121206/5706_1 /TAXON_ID=485358 ORGANISM="Aristerostoma sp., Strain ATCC 50986" /NCGR_SAMPLE_ID=MMETSP0125 /ASSEMBLY_ACC=CAM_ASM_000245 /LENGTH=108 /DNA_ID=CAMNT_0001773965 /DNA_START=486 /DNA_END=812 /DNA_ORIENTATION=+